MIRLVQARARVDLDQEATLEHVKEVMALVQFSQSEQQINEMERAQQSRLFPGSSTSKTSQLKKFLKLLDSRSCQLGKTLFDRDELKDLARRGGITTGPNEFIDVLNDQGFLLKKGNNIYQYLME